MGEFEITYKRSKINYWEESMEKYKNLSNDSSVREFAIGLDYIDVKFSTGPVYRYSYRSAGQYNVEQMKRLARCGDGLGSFIQRNVRFKYEK